MRPEGIHSRMNKNQIIALLFAFLMVGSMIAWGGLYALG